MKTNRLLNESSALASAALSTSAQAAAPAGASPILGAVTWMQDTLLGEVASGVAVIAVAVVGLMMLSGRLNWRYGATVIVGCFILFGAATIVGGIRATAG
ncbi:TrbC/VirB2 family protein [Sphingomonas oligoaromativorans]|uniref:TrbC/VirB2 family protein n=1 Tax=Sphingomonas oligoaromativorans TaxID=575322 RepID=UPI00141DFCAF|nr:TrbC/VirB2 family protein [Sphingomonas oligoaromativorans]NIJ34969.1 type IV secretion system protein VirB2 [Sphingomonas oligoaromativorans]